MFEASTEANCRMLALLTQTITKIDASELKQKVNKFVPDEAEDECDYMEYDHARRGVEIYDKLKDNVIRNLIIPEVNNISKNIMNNDPKSVLRSANHLLSNKDLNKFLKQISGYSTKNSIDGFVYGYEYDNATATAALLLSR